MTGNNSNRFNVGSQPFGDLRGAYTCNTLGCRFSLDALTELRRRGFSDANINDIDSFQRFETNRAVSERIRSKTPRQVTLTTAAQQMSAEDQERFSRNLEAITSNQQLRDSITAGSVVNGVPAAAAIANITDRIEILQGVNRGLQGIEEYNVNGVDLVVSGSDGSVPDNPLSCFTDVTYHVALSMMSEQSAFEFQRRGATNYGVQVDLNTLKAINRPDRSITLASSGETVTNNLTFGTAGLQNDFTDGFAQSERNYYNIQSFRVENLMEPSQTNPLISSMLNMQMVIVEPHGLKLHEDIRNTGIQLGYTDINPGRILYRVDIYFSGYDSNTGEWIEQIDISNGRGTKIVSSVMSITGMEASVNATGTQYTIDMAPAGHFAYRPEDFTMDAQSISSGATFRDFLRNLSTSLYDSKANRTTGEILRNYEFYAPTAILDSPFNIDAFVNRNKFLFPDLDAEQVYTTGRDIDILTLLKDAASSTLIIQELFNADRNNDDFTTPRVHFGVRFNTIYGDKDPTLNDYKEITHQYILEPYVTFKHGAVSKDSLNQYVDPQSQLLRVRELIRLGMLRRVYNYIYTSENTEVIDFDVNLKTFYFNALNLPDRTQTTSGPDTNVTSSDIRDVLSDKNDLLRIATEVSSQNFLNVETTIRSLFGNYRYDLSAAGNSYTRSGADRLGGGINEKPSNQYRGDSSSPSDQRRENYETYLDDYFSTELLNLDGMRVRGDPVWLLSPYANVDVGGLEKVNDSEGVALNLSQSAARVTPRSGQIIFLKILPPNQNDYMNPNRQSGSSYSTILGGFYQITNVTSIFEGGTFTQEIAGVKLNHLNYVEELFERAASGGTPLIGAVDNNRREAQSIINNGSEFTPIITNTPTLAGGADAANPETAYNFFVNQGFTPAQSAGLVGNFIQESGQNLDTTILGDGGRSIGIAQWNSTRRSGLVAFAEGQGIDPSTLDAQLQYVVYELNNTETRARDALLNTTNATDAASVVSQLYERPGTPHLDSRISYANSVLNRFSG